MNDKALIPINIVIGDRNYRLKIEPKDEEVVRGTVKTINEKLVDFKTNFAGKDMQDYIAMTLLWFATTHQQPASKGMSETDTERVRQLSQLEKLLDTVLEGGNKP
jgi:Cell division protein ZapA